MLKGHFHSFCFLTSSSTLKAFIGANTQCQGEYYGITLVLLEGLRFWTESRGLGLVRERERERECPCVYSFPTAKTIIGLFKTSSSPHVDYSPVLNSENRIFQTEVKVRTRWCHGPMGGRQGAQGDPQKIGRKIKINVVNKLNQYFLFKIFITMCHKPYDTLTAVIVRFSSFRFYLNAPRTQTHEIRFVLLCQQFFEKFIIQW